MYKSDTRDGARVACEFEATIELESGGRPLRAVVRNLSTYGARLEGSQVAAAPEDFELLIERRPGGIVRRRARRVWRIDGAMGVTFVDREEA